MELDGTDTARPAHFIKKITDSCERDGGSGYHMYESRIKHVPKHVGGACRLHANKARHASMLPARSIPTEMKNELLPQ